MSRADPSSNTSLKQALRTGASGSAIILPPAERTDIDLTRAQAAQRALDGMDTRELADAAAANEFRRAHQYLGHRLGAAVPPIPLLYGVAGAIGYAVGCMVSDEDVQRFLEDLGTVLAQEAHRAMAEKAERKEEEEQARRGDEELADEEQYQRERGEEDLT